MSSSLYSVEIVDAGVTVEIAPTTIEVEISPNVIEIELACSQGPAGPPGTNTAEQVHQLGILTTDTVVMDALTIADVKGAKWLVWAEDTVGAMGYLEITSDKNADFTVSNVFDDDVPMGIVVAISGGDFELRITNNHTLTVDYRAVRFTSTTVL
jgi:hypothetical protein